MKLKEYLLVLIVPFNPKGSFKVLKETQNKGKVILCSIGITLLLLLLLYCLRDSPQSEYLSFLFPAFIFSLGFIFKVVLIGVITAIVTSKVFNHSLRLIESIAIVSVSSLPLIIGSLIEFLTSQTNAVFGFIGLVIFGMVAAIGISVFYKQSIGKSILIIMSILIIVKFLEISILGIPITNNTLIFE